MFFLGSLEATEDDFMWKIGSLVLKAANEVGLIIISPDTSPRNVGPKQKQWDLGPGASFYVDATTEEYKNYQMYTYIVSELFDLVVSAFPVDSERISITGRSMGGHGALVLGLRNPHKFKCISAFSPICNPINVRVGINCYTNYLGGDKNTWKIYDATELIKFGTKYFGKILIDCGTEDPYLKDYLLCDNLIEVAANNGMNFQFNWREGYDHSYYFVASFIESHLKMHIECLKK